MSRLTVTCGECKGWRREYEKVHVCATDCWAMLQEERAVVEYLTNQLAEEKERVAQLEWERGVSFRKDEELRQRVVQMTEEQDNLEEVVQYWYGKVKSLVSSSVSSSDVGFQTLHGFQDPQYQDLVDTSVQVSGTQWEEDLWQVQADSAYMKAGMQQLQEDVATLMILVKQQGLQGTAPPSPTQRDANSSGRDTCFQSEPPDLKESIQEADSPMVTQDLNC